MIEKIYCWGQLSEGKNTFEPVCIKIIEGYDGLTINRNCKFIWKNNHLYSWRNSFTDTPELVRVMKNKIVSAAYGKDSELIQTNDFENIENPLGIISLTSTSSGHVYLNKKSEVYSWSSQALLLSKVFSISSDFSDFFALLYTGEVYKWAHIHIPAPLFIPEKISLVSCGAEHSVFLSVKGDLFVLGSNAYGQISLGPAKNTLNPVLIKEFSCCKVACGAFHTLILGKDQKVYSCGLGNMGQLANGSFENSEFFTFCSIKEDFGEIIDIYCTELSTLIKFSLKHSQTNTFRPVNLKPKSFILAFIHRIIVADAEKNYLDKLAKKEKIKEKEKKRQLLRESEIQKSLKLFETKLISNWDSVKNTKLVANLIKKGLPSKVRGEVWRLLSGNHLDVTKKIYLESLSKAKNLQTFMKNEDSTLQENSLRLISLDISRTFNNLGYFSEQSPLTSELKDLLEAASVYHSEIGYIQGMSYVAGMLLLNLETFQAFQVFVKIITSPLLLSFFKIDQDGIHYRENIFSSIFSENLPELCMNFRKQGVHPAIFLMEWFVTLYSKTLCQEVAVRVWDMFFYFGPNVLFSTGVAILMSLQDKLIDGDLACIMENLSHISEYITDADKLVALIDQVKISEDCSTLIKNL